MKWSSVENSLGSYTFGSADTEVGVAVCHGMRVRGHNLVWATGAQTPSYAFGDGTNSPANQATVTANIQEHIKAEVTHFGSQVYAWDVVNEPLDPSQPDCLVHGPFYQVLGKSYIDVALEAAREYAPPGTKLFINEYSTSDPARLACLVRVVRDLQNRGIPIDAVGHEMHNDSSYPAPSAVEQAIRTVGQLGVDQQVTEFDLSVYHAGDNTSNYGANGGTVPPSIIAQQGYLYAQYFEVFRRVHHFLSGVTFWGMADDDTWLDSFPVSRLDLPLPFDTELQAKPAYWGIVDPTQLPGYGLTFSVTSKTGPSSARVWTVTASNPSTGVAYTLQINGFNLRQLGLSGQCSPVVTPPSSFPVALGDLAAGSSASVSFTINFAGCEAEPPFVLEMPWSAANGADSHTLVRLEQL
jgi:endo-1,4-beta-xylanase